MYTYPTVLDQPRNYDVDILEDKHLVMPGNIGTAAGCLAAINLMEWAIERLYDEKVR
ncbi:type 1 glutamine amidotransferase family protein [Adhaeribacter arboris]|uniref:hypothetical protein n=1 Tax=Adhaeribacter arboris TaxID=2072846 RepID=UPI001304813D|nr:hypothetical protein [Adhaeribacter arboris]